MSSEHDVALGATGETRGRGALLVAVAVVAVVVAGLIVGSGSDEDDRAEGSPPPATTTAPPAATTVAPPSPSFMPEVTPPPVGEGAITVGPLPELAGMDVYAVVDREVVRVDPSTGETTVLATGQLRAERSSGLIARTGGVVVVLDNSVLFVPGDGSDPVALGGGPIWPAADPALLWQGDMTTSGALSVRLVQAATGEEVHRLRLPAVAYPVGDDGTGRLLVASEGGGAYVIDPASEAVTKIGAGRPVGAGGHHVLQVRCDDQLVCGAELVDSTTSDARSIPAELQPFGFAAIDPTGAHVAALEELSGDPRLVVVDLGSGDRTDLGGVNLNQSGPESVQWTSDGSTLVWAGDRELVVWTVGGGDPVRYPAREGAGDGRVTAVAVGERSP